MPSPKKYLFLNDYSEGAHPRILEAFRQSNMDQEPGYVGDRFAEQAADRIRQKTGNLKAAVHFVSTGTQANLVMLAAMLKPYESVIATQAGHINVHEGGAIEATGHKINTVPHVEGRLLPEKIEEVVALHQSDQMVKPKVVYISQSTELGTVYTLAEMKAIREVCQKHHLYLYVDGARLGHGLVAAGMDLASLSELADAFYIGGTKNGALIGEAIVINAPELQENFRYHLRQRGALLAKARAVTVQFHELFKDDLYFENARHANAMGQKLAKGIQEQGYGFLTQSTTNLIFPILPNSAIERLEIDYGFYVRKKIDEEKSALRLVTSWATPEKAVGMFLEDLKVLN